MKNRAILLDRDGTLVHPRHYPSRPEDLVLYDGIGLALRRLQEAGFRLIVITNQSGIARGYFTEDDLARMHDSLARELGRSGVRLDGVYYCPHHPDGVLPQFALHCTCRKPRPGMLLRAAADLDLDLGRSWLVGDILDDVEAGNRVGCKTILVDLGTESLPTTSERWPQFVAQDTMHALRIIRSVEHVGRGPAPALAYLPAGWRPGVYAARPPELIGAGAAPQMPLPPAPSLPSSHGGRMDLSGDGGTPSRATGVRHRPQG